MKKEEKEHLEKVASLGCICCALEGWPMVPAEVHHIRDGYGLSQRASHFETIPLCPYHHRIGSSSFHEGRADWLRKFGSERKLLEIVWHKLGFDPAEHGLDVQRRVSGQTDTGLDRD